MIGRTRVLASLASLFLFAGPALAEPPAKAIFGDQHSPAALAPASIGFYSKGCLAGAAQLPADGQGWQVMRLSRDRRWGHPVLVNYLERLASEAQRRGIWPGLLVGDLSMARGGPMPFGHSSHQVGLDADIWLRPMPAERLSAKARETYPFRSVLKDGALTVDDRIWSDRYRDLIALAASDRQVERIFVHPGIKKKLCETTRGDRSWLNKVRPFYGHDAHFHVRLACQPGSPGCEPQRSTGTGDGCGDLGWWFNVALQPPPPGAKPPKKKPPLMLSDLPRQCRVVLNAPGPGLADTTQAATPRIAYPALAEVPTPKPRPFR